MPWGLLLLAAPVLAIGCKVLFSGQEKARQPAALPFDERTPLLEVLEEHRRRVQRFILAGNALMSGQTIDDSLEGKRVFYEHPTVFWRLWPALLLLLLVKIGFLSVGPVILAHVYGIDHPAPWVALLGACAVALFVRYYYPMLVRWGERSHAASNPS